MRKGLTIHCGSWGLSCCLLSRAGGNRIRVPNFRIGGGSDEVETFLIQHGFIRVSEYDKAGWTPLCYAALGGNPQMIEALLKKRADPNQAICKNSPTAFLFKGSTALSICSRFGNNEAMQILLRARANLNHQDTQGCIPLHFTATLVTTLKAHGCCLKPAQTLAPLR